jgi:hypothetical protein
MPRMNSIMERCADLPPRSPRPHPHLEPAAPASRPTRVRALLQFPPPPSRHRKRPPAAPTPPPDRRSAADHSPQHTQARPPGGILHEYQHAA